MTFKISKEKTLTTKEKPFILHSTPPTPEWLKRVGEGEPAETRFAKLENEEKIMNESTFIIRLSDDRTYIYVGSEISAKAFAAEVGYGLQYTCNEATEGPTQVG